ncbi:MAG: hypothetical protein NC828_01215 [Candidatus Omnitrophica bacterium]|nr:hypothetical protein [Candidatus Omnitrophota bacterium]
MKTKLIIVFISTLFCFSEIGYCAVQMTTIDKTGEERLFLGTVTDCLRNYAIIKELKTQKDFLYKEGDIVNNRYEVHNIYGDYLIIRQLDKDKRIVLSPGDVFRGFKFLRTAEIYKFEYWYRIKDIDVIKDERFELVDIRCFKAILVRDCKKEECLVSQDKPVLFSKTAYLSEEEQSVDELFLDQLETKKRGDNIWIVAGKSVTTPVLNKATRELIGLTKKARNFGFDSKSGVKLRLTTKVASGMLSGDGFLVDSLGPQLVQKTGFLPGDIIKSVNGRKITSMLGLVLLFLEITKDNVSHVTVDIVRNNTPKRLIYLIK